MDFSVWSPSHTILVAITLLTFGVQLIVILISLKIRTERLEKRQDMTDNRIESFRLEITKQISETRIELRGEIRDVRTELSKLNQNHIDHLTHHNS